MPDSYPFFQVKTRRLGDAAKGAGGYTPNYNKRRTTCQTHFLIYPMP